nr:sugar ABC transporter ATP-binding protein [Rhodococcus sp. (in: high G+C Gram-positive bacteria)]
MISPDPIVNIVGLSKTFGVSRVLSDVGLTVHAGEVHGLLGENGSGKSTLIKVLAGFHAPDPGASLQIRGRDAALPVPAGKFRDYGITFVHQDLALVPDLSVVENLRVGSVVAGSKPWISWRRETRSARALFDRYGVDIDPSALVSTLSATQRALVAIMRAVEELGENRTLLVLDEPTVFLPREGTDLLFEVVRGIVADKRAAVLLVSHDLDEVLAHTDRITILRDGISRGTHRTSTLDASSLISLIVGRELAEEAASHHAPEVEKAGPSAAVVTDLCSQSVRTATFTVRQGEILGLTGIAGSGYDNVLPAMYGAAESATGSMTLGQVTVPLNTLRPIDALTGGVVYVPPDRRVLGGVPELTVEENVTLPVLGKGLRALPFSTGNGPIRKMRLLRKADELARTYDVRPADASAAFGSLSGGNQQKAVLGKWLQTEPSLVLLAEPTQGVDVGARANIFDILRTTAASGAGVVIATTDYEQLSAVCDRVLVFSRGEIVAELRGARVNKNEISDMVLGLNHREVSA